MKTPKSLLVTILMLLGIAAQAQVSGDVILIDAALDTLLSHSGVMVVFRAISGPAVTDTAYTDATGNYNDTLASGTYEVTISKQGFTFIRFNNYFSAVSASVVPTKVLYEMRTYLPLTQSNGSLLPFTSYEAINTLTIAAGDTLIIPEGTWVNLRNGLNIAGCLIIQGTATNPAYLFYGDTASGGIELRTMQVVVSGGGSFIADHARLLLLTPLVNNSFVKITNSSTFHNKPFFLNLSSVDLYCHFELHNSTMEFSDCDANFHLWVEDLSHVQAYCNKVGWGQWFGSGSTFDYQDNWIAGEVDLGIATDSGTFKNNYFTSVVKVHNTLSSPVIKASFINNTFTSTSGFTLDGPCEIKAINNQNIYFGIPNNPIGGAVITDARYNLLSAPVLANISIAVPQGILLNPNATFTDTIDAFNNHYVRGLDIFPDSFPVYHAGLDSFWVDKGDPSILDIDGSRSDIGVFKDTANCQNPAIPLLRPDTVVVVVIPIDSVYPGDANYDGVCDNFDLLPIGYLYSETGPTRPGASLVWTGQYCDPWTATLPNGRNAKHTDCDGNGTVDYNDVDAIYQNYGLTHQIQKQQQFGEGLWLQFPSDRIFEGDTVEVKVMLGTNQSPVAGIYGLAFSINYDPAFVAAGSARMVFDSCWLGTDSLDLVTFFKEVQPASRYDIGLSRTDRQQVSGSGQIGTLIVVINDDIQAKDSMTLTTFMEFINIGAKNASYNDINIASAYSDFNVEVGYERLPNSVENTLANANISIYPNPAKDQLHIKTGAATSGMVSIYTLDGNLARQSPIFAAETVLDIAELSSGFYLLKLQTSTHTHYLKLLVD